MRMSLFNSFADMIEAIPVCAIARTLEREQRMLEEDLFCQRPVPLKQVESVLAFCRFVDAAKEGLPVPAPANPLPDSHLEFYRKTVERLIAAEELPYHALAEFDQVNANDSLSRLLHHAV